MLKPKSGLGTSRHSGSTGSHFKSPRLHFPIVSGLPVLNVRMVRDRANLSRYQNLQNSLDAFHISL